jgi:CRP-like cAMP-binding protein
MPRTVGDELASIDLFAALDRRSLDELAAATTARRLAAGQILFAQGDPSDHLVVVRSGRLRVLVSSDRGDELVFTVLGSGDVLGELSMIDGLPRSATVSALDPSVVLLLPEAAVRRVLLQSPEALLAVARQLGEQVRRLTGSAADLVFLDLPRRLAKLVLSRAEGPDGYRVADLGVNQSGLAAQLGTTRQSVNRALAGLVRRHWIELDGEHVAVRDESALRAFAGMA